jgi:hypothetical protein
LSVVSVVCLSGRGLCDGLITRPEESYRLLCVCVCLSGRGLCDGLIIRPEESYRLCCVIVCDLETSRLRRLKPASGL